MRYLFTTVPRWVQQAGLVVGVLLAGVAIFLVWRHRRAIGERWRRTGTGFRAGLGAAVGVAVLAGLFVSWHTWDYMQHDNDFCMSCHVMDVAFERFTTSEHSELSCHDCHRQPISASVRQVYLWVLNRPDDIGEHAPVANEVCAECHIQERPDSVWQRIAATAGHRVHLESDSLAGLMCVNCHGVEVHRFVPVDETCGQSACHDPKNTEVVLGSMAGQTGLHCVVCHQFTAPVSETVPIGTARTALMPGMGECYSCHEMEEMVVGLDPLTEPHGAVCATCHDPHTQETPGAAAESCATAACHAMADTLTPAHRGLGAAVAEDCVMCHVAHTFTTESGDCLACHADIFGGPASGERAAPPAQAPSPARDGASTGSLIELVTSRPPRATRGTSAAAAHVQRAAQEGFDHLRHRNVTCATCHSMTPTHGAVTVAPADCMACHHTRPVATTGEGCARCHGPGEMTRPRTVQSRMALDVWTAPRTRALPFDHAEHAGVGCARCHTGGVTLAATAGCADCHGEHHQAASECRECHFPSPRGGHTVEVHTSGCAGSSCHDLATYGELTRGRNTCTVCHQDMVDHRPGQACAACHQVAAPVTAGRAAAMADLALRAGRGP